MLIGMKVSQRKRVRTRGLEQEEKNEKLRILWKNSDNHGGERCAGVIRAESPVLIVPLQKSLEAEKQMRMDLKMELNEEWMKSLTRAIALVDCQPKVKERETHAGSRMAQLRKEIAGLGAKTKFKIWVFCWEWRCKIESWT